MLHYHGNIQTCTPSMYMNTKIHVHFHVSLYTVCELMPYHRVRVGVNRNCQLSAKITLDMLVGLYAYLLGWVSSLVV